LVTTTTAVTTADDAGVGTDDPRPLTEAEGDREGESLPARAHGRAALLRESGDRETAALLDELAEDHERVRRQLVRLGFDMHDGPLQALAAATADLRLFQTQLEGMVSGIVDGDKLVARIDDLVARNLDLGEQLRRLITGANDDPATTSRLSTVFATLSDAYDGFEVSVIVEPGVDDLELSNSQRIALARVVRGALDNVAQHSNATRASVTVRTADGGIEAEVSDNGTGFEPQHARGRDSSIGLVAMEERVRLLDGALTIDSKPGGPTTVRVVLPRWRSTDPD
jgi:signal transduction histidine kinase